jgi:hypothetical protein
MRKVILIVFFILSACAPKQQLSKEDQESACPSALNLPQHEVVIHSTGILPSKLAIQLEGEWRWSECASYADKPPIVRVQRSANKVSFTVLHQDFYAKPPENISFRLVGADSCGSATRDLLAVNQHALRFVTDYPNGKDCGARTKAQAVFIQQ